MKGLGFISPAFPFEIALALGYKPRLLTPAGVSVSRAEGFLPRNFCAYLKLILATLIQENGQEPIFVPLEDESHRRFFEVLKELLPGQVIALEIPLRKDEQGAKRFAHAFNLLAHQLGRDLRSEALREAITLGNALRKALREAKELWLKGKLSSLAYYDLRIKAFSPCSPESIRNLTEVHADNPGPQTPKPRIMLASGVIAKRPLIELIEKESFAVVAEDTELGDRYPLKEIPVGESVEENLLSLARAYLNRPPSPRDLNPRSRISFYEGLIKARKVQGVVFSYYKFCDPALAEYPFLASYLKRWGIPCLLLEEEDEDLSGQNITRIQAFLEMVRCGLRPIEPSDV
ncbi:MAG: 2-hydroxyacyl-CoA dehydratase family protein [Anaerolineae bacterium]|nr:2-hydroxyacyl-CoA dehydratase family protein [Anaerolineae bacterium]MDW8101407.1 2-hydroxyacyl-CoA dehydratase family protein [Anaerolineae bacterium]